MRLVVVGASLGGVTALTTLLSKLPTTFSLPLMIVLHISDNDESSLAEVLSYRSALPVEQGEPWVTIEPGHVYVSPADYHMLVEKDFTISLSLEEKINYSRPSIDVLFESAAHSLPAEIIGVLLTGSNSDGAKGIKAIHDAGGMTLVESPDTAFCRTMPASALELCTPNYVIPVSLMAETLCFITGDVYDPKTEYSHRR